MPNNEPILRWLDEERQQQEEARLYEERQRKKSTVKQNILDSVTRMYAGAVPEEFSTKTYGLTAAGHAWLKEHAIEVELLARNYLHLEREGCFLAQPICRWDT